MARERVLPAYYSDNYVALLPGESQDDPARCPAAGSRVCDARGARLERHAGAEPITAAPQGGKR